MMTATKAQKTKAKPFQTMKLAPASSEAKKAVTLIFNRLKKVDGCIDRITDLGDEGAAKLRADLARLVDKAHGKG